MRIDLGMVPTKKNGQLTKLYLLNQTIYQLSPVTINSVLGPILFLVYINDLEEGVTGNILKFADDTKLFTKTKEIGDKQNLQDGTSGLKNGRCYSILGQMSTHRTNHEL